MKWHWTGGLEIPQTINKQNTNRCHYMKTLTKVALCALTSLLGVASANAWHLSGQLQCPNGVKFENILIRVNGTACSGAFSDNTLSDADGVFVIALPDCDGSFTATLDV